MKAKEWIQRIIDNPHWGRVDIDHEAVDELDKILNGSNIDTMGQVALIGGLTTEDLLTVANLKHKGLMPFLNKIDKNNIGPGELLYFPGPGTRGVEK